MSIKRFVAVPLALGSLLALAMGGSAFATDIGGPGAHEHPTGASPFRASLVPAFIKCGDPGSSPINATHASPLTGPSCNPPVPNSSTVAIGPLSLAFARLIVLGSGQCAPFDSTHCFPDVTIRINITDVRSGGPTGPDYNPAGTQDLTGSATVPDGNSPSNIGDAIQITDAQNQLATDPTGPFDKSATVTPLPFPVPVACTTTASTSVGSTCSAQTTANTVVGGSVVQNKRGVVEIGQLMILDQSTKAFEVQGIFIP